MSTTTPVFLVFCCGFLYLLFFLCIYTSPQNNQEVNVIPRPPPPPPTEEETRIDRMRIAIQKWDHLEDIPLPKQDFLRFVEDVYFICKQRKNCVADMSVSDIHWIIVQCEGVEYIPIRNKHHLFLAAQSYLNNNKK